MSEATESLDRVMVIAAHPDDPEFGCAGTVVKWAQAGRSIAYVLLTSGDKGSHDPDLRPGRLAALREEEQRTAARDLGVKQVIFLRYPDGLLENTLELRRQLSNLIRQHRPHIVMTIDPWRHYQLHPDHRAAGQAALDGVWWKRIFFGLTTQTTGRISPCASNRASPRWRDTPARWAWTQPDWPSGFATAPAIRVRSLATRTPRGSSDCASTSGISASANR
jgi:LmbE family N-acetylglucosaminyl deacetylase